MPGLASCLLGGAVARWWGALGGLGMGVPDFEGLKSWWLRWMVLSLAPWVRVATAGINVTGPPIGRPCHVNPGSDLLSQALAHQVPSAQRGLTALFGMGRGVAPSL